MPIDLDDLIAIAPPPESPVETGSTERWEEIERALGTPLPDDYKRIIDLYGSGDFGDFLAVLNPFSEDPGMNLLCQVSVEAAEAMGLPCHEIPILDRYREARDDAFSEECRFPAYPEPGGLLPVARSLSGGEFFWRTRGAPDDWTLVLFDPRGGYDSQEYPVSLVEFLTRWLSGAMPDSFFGTGNSPTVRRDPAFIPIDEA